MDRAWRYPFTTAIIFHMLHPIEFPYLSHLRPDITQAMCMVSTACLSALKNMSSNLFSSLI